MSYLIQIPEISDSRGTLNFIDKLLPFDIRRVFYISDVKKMRGGHRHKKTTLALICIHGQCLVKIQNLSSEDEVLLNSKNQCLILDATDWHTMDEFSNEAVLLVLASEYYDEDDYIYEPYK